MLKGIGVAARPTNMAWTIYVVYFCITFFYFLFFKTYTGVVRHSTLIDAIKLFISQSAAFITLFSLNGIYEIYSGEKLFLNTYLFLNVTLSFCLLLFYRISIKQLYETVFSSYENSTLTPVIVLVKSTNAIAVTSALRAEQPKRFKVVGFISSEQQLPHKRIINLPVFSTDKKTSSILRYTKAKALIVADKDLTTPHKIAIVEDCLHFNYKVYNLAKVSDWNDTKKIASNVKNIKIQDLLERKPIELDFTKISEQLENKTVLITGAAGSIGGEIVWQVTRFKPSKIILVDQAETPLHHISLELEKLHAELNIVCLIVDVRNFDLMEFVFQKHQPDVIYHAAAYKHVPLMEENPCQAVLTNVLGSKNMADLAVKYHCSHFVMVSTDKAVNPSNIMGASKRIAEKYVQSLAADIVKNKTASTKFITTRFGNVLGSNGSVVPLFTKQIAEGGPITITHPEIIRYFMTIPEACQLVLEAGAMGNGGEIYIFDMGKPVKIIDLAKKMIKMAELVPEKDIEIKIVGLRPGEKLYEELLNNTSMTLPTHHEKIMIVQDTKDLYDILQNQIIELTHYAHTNQIIEMVTQMKQIVPEFKSLNSQYAKLDTKPILLN
ncbi:nucleoside-diphosphate sugar epimerase/dehydratase [Flavobacterium sp. NKUCC04_CG]|uniref:polysaccharide biosynthesis protein n=1 Tax=Flavobacterium sp. NKUCC04_CG TaxID=2842121 RepID=UPI0021027110|nr:nucleoside-diphosphate sugar epimerase/dehydratase [Flavobacterium sp. NKUCC04_CG]